MRNLKYVVYREGDYFVSQCLNTDISSFGESIDEAVKNLKDAVELYLRDDPENIVFNNVGDALIGEAVING
ncbi:MAG TPA: type II toxin-antitoxin system HicB family antitoxin [Spirochaetota bacterium]|nr:type II toxin-antitoxin system HicB family antitoxin [Spirochaetota bacterium]HPJ39216.1 type II toxin-antitoxin system HicB family antitoxin [Spirochaetota bacterium]